MWIKLTVRLYLNEEQKANLSNPDVLEPRPLWINLDQVRSIDLQSAAARISVPAGMVDLHYDVELPEELEELGLYLESEQANLKKLSGTSPPMLASGFVKEPRN